MSLLVNHMRSSVQLAVLASVLCGILGLFSWVPKVFYIVYVNENYLIFHSACEIICISIALAMFIVVWYGWPQTKNSRDLVIAMFFLAVGLLDLAHLLSYKGMPDFITANNGNKAALFWIISRLLAGAGLLAAVYIPRRSKNPAFHRLYLLSVTLVTAFVSIALVIAFEQSLPPMFIPGQGITLGKVVLEYLTVLLNLLAVYLYGHRNSAHKAVYLLRVGLIFSMVAGVAFTLYSDVYDSINLLGHIYKIAAYYCVLRALLQTSFLCPYIRIARLNRALRAMVSKNMTLYKDTKDSERILKQAFIQLGATLASKHDLDGMLQQVVSATGTVFQCEHVYLALVKDKILEIVAYISSFKPPDKISPENSFMGKVYLEKKPLVVDRLSLYPDWMIDAVRRAGLKSMVGAPIRHNGDVIGVLEIFSRKEKNFTTHDAQFLSVFSHQAGEAIKNARAYETTVESFEELSLLYDIVKELAMQKSPAAILTGIADKLYNLFAANGVVAFIMHHRDDGIHTEPVFANGLEQKEINHLQHIFSDSKMTWPWSGLSNIDADTAYESERGLITMSVLLSRRLNILPLLASGKLQGLIVLAWNDPLQEIPPGKELVLITIASQTAIGLERAYLYDHFQAMALTDPLTRLANRRQFEIVLGREISRTINYHRPLSLVMFDIDFFKKVNDTWGHLAGDAILQRMGVLIKENFRQTDMTARYGGEEFAAVLPETCLAEAVQLAETFRKIIENAKFEVDQTVIEITISLGVATFESSSTWSDPKTELIDAADQALYHAKQQGRNRVECHKPQDGKIG
ncbi:MASE3 domain-containing protein [Sporomusa acidovorans]|uniref:GGDEF domain-containing protein n=1 Tax=Sporomusa acidovorans (strain ATCC 49682 / DSM 3132 / Mol) TaxID=1123286 RepID=A0ABZ3JAY2_SPOA4|nr:MASE3 domain-containing protein [Sporomusa acidovorans]OZC22935.1 response regulator PleD [Sporomusa acidovorans DSM 3132]SDE94791.1 diguanylate cyclase (GGDEF) domain-containing protein [Sporomusa acidovorans]